MLWMILIPGSGSFRHGIETELYGTEWTKARKFNPNFDYFGKVLLIFQNDGITLKIIKSKNRFHHHRRIWSSWRWTWVTNLFRISFCFVLRFSFSILHIQQHLHKVHLYCLLLQYIYIFSTSVLFDIIS
jgi:hypothetical protein